MYYLDISFPDFITSEYSLPDNLGSVKYAMISADDLNYWLTLVGGDLSDGLREIQSFNL